MKDLYRCLDEYTPQMLEAIAAAWHVELPEGEPRERLGLLAEAMQQPDAAVRVFKGLALTAQEVLADLLREGGALPAHRLTVLYGGIRRLGPARIAREQPWLHPETALEELFYKGLVCRVYDTVDAFYGEVISVPSQLIEPLTALAAPVHALGDRVHEPERVVCDADSVAEDLFRLLVAIRVGRIGTPQGEQIANEALLQQVPVELVGEADGARLELLYQLTLRLGLVEARRGILRPSLRAREWLQLPDDRRSRSMFIAWRDNPQAAELYRLPHLVCDPQETEHNPAQARRALLEELTRVEPCAWLSLEGFVQGLKRRRPDFLRPDGDYDRWPIRSAANGGFVSGFAFWDQVEGALARHILVGPLRWLGIVALGFDADSDSPHAFRVTEMGTRVLSGGELADGDTSGEDQRAIVSNDLTVIIPVRGTLYERYQLERFAVRESQAEDAIYRLTPESLWRGQNTGVKVEQIIRFLGKLGGEPVAPELARTLQAWAAGFGRVALERSVVLRTTDERTMQKLASHPRVRQLLGQQLTPTICLVPEEHLDTLLEQLKTLGIWPELTA